MPGEQLSAAVVQSLYARFRVRFWQGANNSIDNHVGYAVTPFSEVRFSVPAMWIPLDAKRDGWFERQLIIRASPALAHYASNYGYNFARGPAMRKRITSTLKHRMPAWLRAARRRLAKAPGRPYYQSEKFINARFGSGPLQVEEYVRVGALKDSLAFSRALTVERLLRGEWLAT
jgi:hypothetical protein